MNPVQNSDRAWRAAAGVLTVLLLLVAPPPVTGQWQPVGTATDPFRFVVSPPHPIPEDRASPAAFGESRSAVTPVVWSQQHTSTLNIDDKGVRKRLWPYFVAGAVVGGVAGYLYRDRSKSVDEDWGVGYIVWPLNGIAAGGLVGLGVGYLVERR